MDIRNQFDWVDFYKEFANKLLTYKEKRSELVGKVKAIYQKTGINMPTLDREKNLIDIDPFTIFGLFNKKMREENRIKVLKVIAELFEIRKEVQASFNSLPVLNPLNAIFYNFIDQRDEDEIDNLWGLFESALSYAKNPSSKNKENISHYFDIAINIKGNGNSKITMGLYWIAPDAFLNLDSRNEWYIYESGKIPANIVNTLPAIEQKISATDYFTVVEALRHYLQSPNSKLKDFKELSFEAWLYSEEINKRNRAKIVAEEEKSALPDEDIRTVHYWIYSPGEGSYLWEKFYEEGIMAIGKGAIGDLSKFTSKSAMKEKMKETYEQDKSYMNAAHATWQFVHEMSPGDVIYVKKGRNELIGRGVVTSDYQFDAYREGDYKNIRHVDWTHKGHWPHPGYAVTKTLTDITAYTEYVNKIKALFEDYSDEELEDTEKNYPAYTKEDFLSEVYLPKEEYEKLVDLLYIKKNIILQGAPGVGKTYLAKRLAYSMMGEKDIERVMMVQFHQSYSYEDFIMGYRPSNEGFELKKGVFYNFCKRAEIDEENDYFFIIDEINRGNLSKIFGELFMLLENDKRGASLQLLYSDEKFAIPKNVYIIGMMNTADRSLAMLDYALRRRFAFYELKPAFKSDGFSLYRESLENEKFDRLITCVEKLNEDISLDASLGQGFSIGHSYFCNLSPETINDLRLSSIVEYELIPLLKEYWFDEVDKVRDWSNNLRSAIK